MKKLVKITGIAVLIVGVVWAVLTFWVESAGPKRSWTLGDQTARENALIVYDPDPFYNLDEQISRSFGQALADQGIRVTIATVAAAPDVENQPVDLYVFCANTYNFCPDWAVSNFIEKQRTLEDKYVMAITIGGGSTTGAQKVLNQLILSKKGNLLDSRSLWLLRPNDESRLKEPNVAVSVSMAYAWGKQMAERIKSPQLTDGGGSAPQKSIH